MNFYNEHDPKAAAWLRELIAAGHIPNGVVDERSIADILPGELTGFTQHHFFCGIGGWPLALQLAGWPKDRPVCTGSCPCQPFSDAGKGDGQDDPRHLWPAFFRLIRECRFDVVFGEQVEGAIGHGWLDGVQANLETEGYAIGHCVLGAHSAGAPHIRQRLYWVANSERNAGRAWRIADQSREGDGTESSGTSIEPGRCGMPRGLGDSESLGLLGWSDNDDSGRRECPPGQTSEDGRVGLANGPGREQGQPTAEAARYGNSIEPAGFWSDFQLIPCLDGKYRRIPAKSQSSIQPLVDGLPRSLDGSWLQSDGSIHPLAHKVQGRVPLLKGAGNAIVPQVAAEFIKAFMEETA